MMGPREGDQGGHEPVGPQYWGPERFELALFEQ